MLKKFLFALLLVLFLATAGKTAETRYNIPIAGNPYLGPADASITIVEFLDFQ